VTSRRTPAPRTVVPSRCLRAAMLATPCRAFRAADAVVIRGIPLRRPAGVFPGVAIGAQVPEADPRVGPDLVAALSCPLAEGEVLGQIPVSLPIGADHRLKERHDRPAEPLVAYGQLQPLLHVQVDLSADEQEPRPAIVQLRQSSAGAEHELGG
jgi:hypothetical protein